MDARGADNRSVPAKLRRWALSATVVVLVAAGGFLIAFAEANQRAEREVANILLHDLSDELEVLKALSGDSRVSPLKDVVVRKLLVVAAIRPNPGDLEGAALTGLCSAIEHFDELVATSKSKFLSSYLRDLSLIVVAEAQRRKEVLKFIDCALIE